MVFTIEPMLTLGGIEADMWDDDWTVITRDKCLTAQFEHTLVVTERGAEHPDRSPEKGTTAAMTTLAIGIDIGGTGIKGAVVDVDDRRTGQRAGQGGRPPRAASPTTSSRPWSR